MLRNLLRSIMTSTSSNKPSISSASSSSSTSIILALVTPSKNDIPRIIEILKKPIGLYQGIQPLNIEKDSQINEFMSQQSIGYSNSDNSITGFSLIHSKEPAMKLLITSTSSILTTTTTTTTTTNPTKGPDNYFSLLEWSHLVESPPTFPSSFFDSPPLLLYSPALPSTQRLLHSSFQSPFSQLGSSIACVADIQTNGKGRGSNSWESPQGCLCVSFKSIVNNASYLSVFQHFVSLSFLSSLPTDIRSKVRLKWPNDIYTSKEFGKQKVGGVLCQAEVVQGSKSSFSITTGLGVNINNEQPTTCIRLLKDKSPELLVSRPHILFHFLATLSQLNESTFSKTGFKKLKDQYLKVWLHSGQVVTASDPDMSPAAGTTQKSAEKLTIRGITDSGFLLAQSVTDPSAYFELSPDTNSLSVDMMDGLVKRKI